ncbi:hypothetical protein [Psychroserpens sp.]
MGDFKNIVSYLKYFRRSEEAKAQNKFFSALLIDENYDENYPPHEEDLIFDVKKELIRTNDGYKTINQLTNRIISKVYLLTQADGEIDYYIRKQVEENNIIVTKYKKLPYEGWEIEDDSLFTPKDISGDIYYHFETNRLISVFLEHAFIFPNNFVYNPKDLEETNRAYNFDYKDEEGYGDGFIDGSLRKLRFFSETKRLVFFSKNEKAQLVNILPAIIRTQSGFNLEYKYYEKGVPHNSSSLETAIQLSFTYFGALQEFLNQTIFYGLNDLNDFDAVNNNAKAIFLKQYLNFVKYELRIARGETVLEILYYTPIFLFNNVDISLWDILTKLSDGFLTNHNLNTEDIALKIIQALYEHKKTPDIFLTELLTRKTASKLKEPILYALAKGIDGENFKIFVSLIHKAWLESNYSELDPEKNKSVVITEETPVLLYYNSNESLGFHTDNAGIKWETKTNKVTVDLPLKTGVYETYQVKTSDGFETRSKEVTKVHHYSYHPFSPIVIYNSKNATFIHKDDEQKDDLFTKLPAFVLYANKESAFWKNSTTLVEYIVDFATIFSGVGNLLKVGRLARIFKSGLSFIAKAKKVTQVSVGVIEVSSGVGNTLIKLTNNAETPLGRAITKYLFYLEMLSLSGELTVALRKSLKTSSEGILKTHAKELDNLKKNAKNADEIKEIDELVEHFENVAGMAQDTVSLRFRNADDFLESAKRLSKIKPEQAIEYLDEALPHFNHYVDGDKVKQISDTNCVNVVVKIEEFLRTGKISKAKHSERQLVADLARKYNETFVNKKIPELETFMKEGELGIIYGIKEPVRNSHVFNVLKINGKIKLVDGQSGLAAVTRGQRYLSFQYLKIK